jgi:hypothetical protein
VSFQEGVFRGEITESEFSRSEISWNRWDFGLEKRGPEKYFHAIIRLFCLYKFFSAIFKKSFRSFVFFSKNKIIDQSFVDKDKRNYFSYVTLDL